MFKRVLGIVMCIIAFSGIIIAGEPPVISPSDAFILASKTASFITEKGDDSSDASGALMQIKQSQPRAMYILTVVKRNIPIGFCNTESLISKLFGEIMTTSTSSLPSAVSMCECIFHGMLDDGSGKIINDDDTLTYLFNILRSQTNGAKEEAEKLKAEIISTLHKSGIDPKQYES